MKKNLLILLTGIFFFLLKNNYCQQQPDYFFYDTPSINIDLDSVQYAIILDSLSKDTTAHNFYMFLKSAEQKPLSTDLSDLMRLYKILLENNSLDTTVTLP